MDMIQQQILFMNFLEIIGIGNLKIYSPEQLNKINKKTMKELNDITIQRVFDLCEAGYMVEYIWESEWDDLIKKEEEKGLKV